MRVGWWKRRSRPRTVDPHPFAQERRLRRRALKPSPKRRGARLFEGHPHCTVFPCDAVEVMPLLGAAPR